MKSEVLLTGATGLLGSNLAWRLLKRGHRVHFLVRNGGISPERRLENAIKLIDSRFRLDEYDHRILIGDLKAPHCGVDPMNLVDLRDKVGAIWHSAASVKFSYEEARAIREVNVCGTQHVLELATELAIPHFHHVSTAYVAGFSTERFLESDHCSDRLFKNAYEKSKLEGEQLVHKYAGKYSIYRPSIIVGDSSQGSTLTFSGIYRVFQVFHLIRCQVMRLLRSQPERCSGAGIRYNDGAGVIVPIVIPCADMATANLVPVDWVAETMLQLGVGAQTSDLTFHLTHPEPVRLRWVLASAARMLGLEGVRFAEFPVLQVLRNAIELVHDGRLLQDVQKSFVDWVSAYLPYFAQEPVFDNTNVREVLRDSYVSPRNIDEGFLRALVSYAVTHRFRQKGLS